MGLKCKKKSINPSPDNSPNIQVYTPAALLKPGQLELKWFNNLYTQHAFFNHEGRRIAVTQKSTYFTGIGEVLYGIGGKLNVGLDAFFKSVTIDPLSNSPLNVFHFNNDANSRTAFTRIGPKIKFVPFPNIPGFSVQSTLFFPVAPDLEGRQNGYPYLDYGGYVWWNRIFYDKTLGWDWKLFFETDISGYVDRHFRSEQSYIRSPVKIFINYFPVDKLSLYGMGEWNPVYGVEQLITGYYGQAGTGVKYQLSQSLEVELLYTNFVMGKQAGAGQTFNIGIRYLGKVPLY